MIYYVIYGHNDTSTAIDFDTHDKAVAFYKAGIAGKKWQYAILGSWIADIEAEWQKSEA